MSEKVNGRKKIKIPAKPIPKETAEDMLPTGTSTDAEQLDTSAWEEESRKQELYGDRPGAAFAGSALAAATFNASDALAVATGLATPEAIQEIRERNPGAAMAGTATGIVGPAVATLGTSAAAQAAATPIRALNAISRPAAAAVAKQFSTRTGRKIAAEVTKNAVEGALIGAGQLGADITMGNRDLSAESLMSTVGVGALWGGGLGGAIGAIRVAAPPALRTGRAGVAKAKEMFGEHISPYSDEVDGYLKALTSTPQQAVRLGEDLGEKYSVLLPDYVNRNLNFGATSTPAKLAATNKEVIKKLGGELDTVLNTLDEAGIRPTRTTPSSIFANVDSIFQTELEKLSLLKGFTKADVRIITNLRKSIIDNLGLKFIDGAYVQTKPLSFKALNETRKLLGSKSYSPATAQPLEKYSAQISRKVYGVLRESLDNIADEIDPALGQQLKQLNTDLHIGLTAQKRLTQAARVGQKVSPRGLLLGLGAATTGVVSPELAVGLIAGSGPAARLVRNAMLVNDLQGKIKKVVDSISVGVGQATKKARTIAGISTQVLVRSKLAANEDNSAPKTKRQAVANVQKNITALAENPEKMIEMLARRTARISELNPELGVVLQQRMMTGLQFLQAKVPRPAVNSGVFQRKYEPSDLELSKFERYFNIVEQPMIVFDEIRRGTLTREHIEALQFVYPEIYKQIRLQTLDLVAKQDLKLPYERKLQLGILLNIPADSSLQPESVIQLQQNLTAPPEQAQPGPQFRASGMQQTGISERAQSGTEKLTSRE